MRAGTKCLALAALLPLAAGLAGYAAASDGLPSATGDGTQLTGTGTDIRTFSFNAIELKNGRIKGHASVVNPVISSVRTFDLSCLTVFTGSNGSPIAVASGVLTSAENPALVGQSGIFAVQDSGEAGDAVDRMTLGVRLDTRPCTVITDEASLIAVFPLGMRPILEGNIQVRG
jgi:hypothetical protein